MIRFDGVSFGYGALQLLSEFSLELSDGQLLSLIGVNGSGKSTFLKLLLGLLKPQSGRLTLRGHSAGSKALREEVGVSLQECDFPGTIRTGEVLRFATAHYEEPAEWEWLVERFDLGSFLHRPTRELSGGMRRRLALACAFAGRPKVLLLDEPTTGLDRASRDRLLEVMQEYRDNQGALIVLVSHHPEEVANSMDRFLLLKPGVNPTLVDPARYQELAKLRKLSFLSEESLAFPTASEVQQESEAYRVFGANSDELVRELSKQSATFSGLEVGPLTTQELLERL